MHSIEMELPRVSRKAGQLPGLSCLKAFVLAIDGGSYSNAADILGVTHAAVIQHVQRLERYVGATLVVRSGRTIVASDKGTEVYLRIRDAIRALDNAFASDVSAPSGQIRLATLPSFANGWLVPLLPALKRRLPGVEVAIDAHLALDDLPTSGADIGIRLGNGHWPGVDARPLLADLAWPVASPSSPGARAVHAPADLLRLPLIENPLLPWRDWFVANGIAPPPIKPVLTVCDSYTAQAAAEHGLGVALGRASISNEGIRRHRLVRLLPDARTLQFDWWLVRPTASVPNRKLVDAFCGALIEMANLGHAGVDMLDRARTPAAIC